MSKENKSNQVADEKKSYKLKRGEEYMSPAMRDYFKVILAGQRGILVNKIDDTVTHLKDETDHISDLNDRATQEEEFSLELRARDREGKLVEKIDDALRLLEEKDYGYCEECGVDIGVKRLEARPTASLCIDCKTLAEIKEKQEGL